MIAYVDTSAAMKLVVDEPESDALVAWIEHADRTLVGSWLLHTEMHCAAGRHGQIHLESIAEVLAAITLADLTRGDLLAAGLHTGLRTLDAIHLATALRLGTDEILTYDQKLAEAARQAGLSAIAPD